MSEPTLCCRAPGGYCGRCDLLVDLLGLHVLEVEREDIGGLTIAVESAPSPMGCRGGFWFTATAGSRCGWSTHRRWVARQDRVAQARVGHVESACSTGLFMEQDERIAMPSARLTARACRWAIEEIRREHACVNGIPASSGRAGARCGTP